MGILNFCLNIHRKGLLTSASPLGINRLNWTVRSHVDVLMLILAVLKLCPRVFCLVLSILIRGRFRILLKVGFIKNSRFLSIKKLLQTFAAGEALIRAGSLCDGDSNQLNDKYHVHFLTY